MEFVEKIKTKAKDTVEKAKSFGKNVSVKVCNYLDANPDMIKPVVYGGIAVVGGVITGLMNFAADTVPAKESCLVEDEVTGLNYRTKHPMTNNEILELSDRMVDGQTTGDALVEMGLLKKERRRR